MTTTAPAGRSRTFMGFSTIGRDAALVVLVALGMGGLAPLAVKQSGEASAARTASYRPESVECQALKKMNAFRRKHGRPPLALSATLGSAAEHHSADMAAKNYFDHNLQGGPTWDQNIRNHGYREFPIGENIAAGMETAAGVVKAWKRSPDHRRGMLDGQYRSVGIGRAYDQRSAYGFYWTATFGGPVDEELSCR